MRAAKALVSAIALIVSVVLVGTVNAAHADVEYTYSVHQRGLTKGDLNHFAAVVKTTLRDERGWSLGGQITFRRVDSEADMRLILASPEEVAEASPGCSEQWSCRVGPQVLINDVRWRKASDSWGKSLRAYQHYVINHEIGHFLGLGHRHCPEPGAAAPVMQQQSIDKEGCRSNVWPRLSELKALAREHDIPVPESSPTPPRPPKKDDPVSRDDRQSPAPGDATEGSSPAGLSGGSGGDRHDNDDSTDTSASMGSDLTQRMLPGFLLAFLITAATAGSLGFLTAPIRRRKTRGKQRGRRRRTG